MIRTWTPERDTPKPPESGVDYHTVKAWFQQLRDLDDEIDNIQLEIQRLRDNATKCTASMSGMPGGAGSGDKVGTCIEKVDAEERRRQALEADLKALRAEAICRIHHIKGTKSSSLMQASLYGYYVQNQKQAVVADSLDLPNENRVALYIRDGTRYLAEIWDDLQAG